MLNFQSFDEMTEKMAYDLRIEVEGDVLWVTATGTRSLQTVLAMSQDIFAACVEKHLKKVLIDVLGLEGRLTTMEAYEVAGKHFWKIRDRSVITHCAIVDLKEFEESYRFFENVAANRGYLLRIFSDTDEAIAWLKK
jgi:hypothetical protein